MRSNSTHSREEKRNKKKKNKKNKRSDKRDASMDSTPNCESKINKIDEDEYVSDNDFLSGKPLLADKVEEQKES